MAARVLAVVSVLLVAASPAVAHPGVGIVMDSRGNVFYTDLDHVWRIAPDGRKSIAVRDVHTHELFLDHQDNLYGEHLWYEGEATDRWGHRVWRLSPDGTLVDVVPARVGFRDDYDDFHFVRDRDEAMYWSDRGEITRIRSRTRSGEVRTLAELRLEEVGWMTVGPDGSVYVTAGPDLWRITREGRATVLAAGLWERGALQFLVSDRHNLMGLWPDAAGNVYVAVYGAGVVKKVSPRGAVTVAARTSGLWSPTGGMVAPNGDLWLLETRIPNAVRVRRIRADGSVDVY